MRTANCKTRNVDGGSAEKLKRRRNQRKSRTMIKLITERSLLLTVVNVDLGFVYTGVGYGLRERFAVGRKLPFIGLGRLAF